MVFCRLHFFMIFIGYVACDTAVWGCYVADVISINITPFSPSSLTLYSCWQFESKPFLTFSHNGVKIMRKQSIGFRFVLGVILTHSNQIQIAAKDLTMALSLTKRM